MEKQIEAWQKTVARYDTEPETHEGRKELAERAKEAEESRNTFLAKYDAYEIASAAFQIGIVLASAAVITEIVALVWLSGLLGAGGLAMIALGLFAPHVLHSLDVRKVPMIATGKAQNKAARTARLSAALRENLKRRKAQARGRAQMRGSQGTPASSENTTDAEAELLTFAAIGAATRA